MSKSGDWFIRENPDDDDSGYDEWLMEQGYEEWLKNNKKVNNMSNEERAKQIVERRKQIAEGRIEAVRYVEEAWNRCLMEATSTVSWEDFTVVQDAEHSLALHDAIWHASTEILPGFEVQAVIDSKNDIYVSTGTSGYVDYLTIDPSTLIGMKLPIKCWIHTHPFGAAYFSGTDWRTINIWEEHMNCAYVLGSQMSTKGHYGFWSKFNKNELEIYENGEPEQTQQRPRGEEE